MSSSSPSSPNGLFGGVWTAISPYVIPPAAASIAIVPVFYGFIAKSALQQGMSMPKMVPVEALKAGGKAAPTVGVIVGTQMIVQRAVEGLLFETNTKKSPGFISMLASSVIVGALSAPALAVFNGQTMGRSITASLQSLSLPQTIAIMIIEVSFLFSLRISKPMSTYAKKVCGDNKVVDYGSSFITGAIGSIVGHPADTALTLWQKNRKIGWRKNRKLKSTQRLMRGSLVKAITVGGFNMIYTAVESVLKSKK